MAQQDLNFEYFQIFHAFLDFVTSRLQAQDDWAVQTTWL